MDVRALHNEADYQWALREVDAYFRNEPDHGTSEGDRFEVLLTLLRAYEDKAFMPPDLDPVDLLEFAIGSMGKSQAELGHLIGRSRASEVLSRRRVLTLEQIRQISEAWALPLDLLAKPYAPATARA